MLVGHPRKHPRSQLYKPPPRRLHFAPMFAVYIEIALCAAGFLLLGWLCVSKAGRQLADIRALAPLDIAPIKILQAILILLIATILFLNLANILAKQIPEQFHTLLAAVGLQLGLATGIAVNWLYIFRENNRGNLSDTAPKVPRRYFLIAAAATCLVALPLVALTSHAWHEILLLLNYDAPPQELVIFFQTIDNLPQKIAFTLVAVLVAPVTEEIIFRGVFYRWLRDKVPPMVALLLPALIFASLHDVSSFLPLVAFAVILSLAYERTGRLLVPIVAHALFNLHTLLLLLAGVSPD